MRIKKRKIARDGISEERARSKIAEPAKVVDFSSFGAKPKEPLPEARFTGLYEGQPQGSLRRLGPLALDMHGETGAQAADDKYTAGDYVRLLREPYDPKNATEVRYRNRIRNRSTGIVAKCVDCAGTRKGVTECAATSCPLWAFRLGGNPFRRRK